jgi:hypothetical protein
VSLAQPHDYEFAYAVDRPPGRTLSAEQWARAMLEGAPPAARWFLIVGWIAITCRLRPRRSPSRILGWSIESSSPEMVTIVVEALIGLTSRLVVSVDDRNVTVGSFVRFHGPLKPLARVVWAAAVPLHERMLPYLLTAATQPRSPNQLRR